MNGTNIEKKDYVTPMVKTLTMSGHQLMIPISGQTTPEDADSKGGYWYEEQRGSEAGTTVNVWDL